MIELPKIALVGRPNVGKSTLFNRIAGRRQAITDSRPGSTRDRNYAQTEWQGAAFELIDTGGLLLGTEDPLLGPAAEQAQQAIAEADLVLFLVDARAGLLPDDEAIAKGLRRGGKKVVVAVNKSESRTDSGMPEFARLGFEKMLPLSAEHGQGVGDLLDMALAEVPRVAVPEEEDKKILRLAIVGRPNVGKSSLLNRLLGSERAVVSAIPGTTRDAVDTMLERGTKKYRLVDTAGIRRTRLLKENVDHVSVVQARKSLERADVALVVINPEEGIRDMDSVIAGYAHEAGRGIVIVVNKWDRAKELDLTVKKFEEVVHDGLKFLAFAPIIFVSAKTGRGGPAILKAADNVAAACRTRITTGEFNRVLARAAAAYAPKAAKGGKPVKILYGTQVGISPPTFLLSLNHPVDLHFSYQRYLENQLRRQFGFPGAPIVFKVKTRRH
jgi:GTP-binding protein